MKTINDRFSLKDKIAVVTGASSGLGVQFSKVLASAGAVVVLAARRFENLEGVSKEILDEGGISVPMKCDITRSSDVEAMFNDIKRRFGGVDILVNNAGIVDGPYLPERVPDHAFEEVISTNVVGLWYASSYGGRQMLERGEGGSIINIASIYGVGGACDTGPGYQASKGAVINLTRNLAVSWADRRVRVNAISPGFFPSEMTNPYFSVDGLKRDIERNTPMGRVGDQDELSGVLLLLASDAGSYITGQNFLIDGGYSASIGQSRWSEDVYGVMKGTFGKDWSHIGKT